MRGSKTFQLPPKYFDQHLAHDSSRLLLNFTDAFSAIRAAAANLINQRSDGSKIESTQSLLVALRTSAKSSLELRRAPDMQNSALRVVEYIEKLWAAAEKSEFGLTSFSEKVSYRRSHQLSCSTLASNGCDDVYHHA